jgi:hypothetical protein
MLQPLRTIQYNTYVNNLISIHTMGYLRLDDEVVHAHKAAAQAVTAVTLARVTGYLVIDDRDSAYMYCNGLGNVAWHGGSLGCATIMAAACIPRIVDCLRAWPADLSVTSKACRTLYYLAENGGEVVKATLRCIPDIKALLAAAIASRMDGAGEWATGAWEILGRQDLHVAGCCVVQ